MKIFAFDSPLMRAINRITDYVILILLWFVCSLPLFTAGAATCAKYYVGMKLNREEEPPVFRTFFSSFKKNFKQTVLPSIVTAAISLLLVLDWYYVINYDTAAVFKWALFVVCLIYCMAVFCFNPIISRYEIKTMDAVKTAIGMAAAKFPRVFLSIVMIVVPLFVALWYFKWGWLILLGTQTVMYHYNCRFFIKEFDKLEKKYYGTDEEEGEQETKEETEQVEEQETEQVIEQETEQVTAEETLALPEDNKV